VNRIPTTGHSLMKWGALGKIEEKIGSEERTK
jgi:hypothetical protein